MNADWLPDKTPVRSPYNRIACGLIGADVRTDWSPQTKTMSGWIKIRVEFIKGLAGQWKGSSHPKTPSETMDTVAEEAPGADSIALQPESQISITCEASPNQQEIERRRKIVRQFFNDFWISTDDKPRTFAERLTPRRPRARPKSRPRFRSPAVDFCGSRLAIGAATERARALAMPAGTRAQSLQTRANSSGVAPASPQVAYRALLERAGSREPADRGGVDGIGPRHIGLRLACSKALERFLALMRRHLARALEANAALLGSLAESDSVDPRDGDGGSQVATSGVVSHCI